MCSFFLGVSVLAPAASAATYDVCASGCDFTTITQAFASSVTAGDTVTVGASYASTTETFGFNIPQGVTLDCQNSGAVIGVDLPNPVVHVNSQGDNVVRNCTFSDVQFQNTNVTSVSILNNTFQNLSSITIDNSTGTTITGNTGLLSVDENNSVDIDISHNEIDSIAGYYFNAIFIGTATGVRITNNTIIDQTTSTPNNYALVNLAGESDILFATNTISMPYLVGANSGASVLVVTGDGVTVTGNTVLTQGGGGTIALNLDAVAHTVTADVNHNTFVMGPTCNGCTGILMTDWASNAVNVSSTYNLIVNEASSTVANNTGHRSSTGLTPGLTLFQNYNGYSGPFVSSNLATTEFPVGSNAIVRPYNELETSDATTSNDFSPAPFSSFLDVNGSQDVGALSGVRGNVFQVSASGTLDYSLVHATDTTVLMSALRSGDTVHLANGTYSPILLDATVDPSARSSNMTITGSGTGTIIHATSTGDALSLLDIHDTVFSDFTLTGATSTTSNTYNITKAEYVFASQTYDESGSLGGPVDSSIVFTSAVCNTAFVTADGMDVTTAAGPAADDWVGGLVNVFGAVHITVFMPSRFLIANGYTVDATGLHTFIASKCGAANTVDQYIPSIFTANGDGTFSYNSGAVAGASATLKGGQTNPPRIDHHVAVNGYAGIVLNDANNNLFTHVTSTDNTYAVNFLGASTGNVFQDSVFRQSSGFDVLDSSSLDNTLSNTSFRSASSSISGNGSIDAFFKARALVQDPLGNTISGANVTFQTANGSTSTALTTDSNGLTGLTGVFPAFILTSSTLAETFGGFNPFVASAAALSGHLAASTSTNLDTPNQLYTISMATAVVHSSGGGGGLSTVLGNNTYAALPSSATAPDVGDAARLSVIQALHRSVHDLVKLADDGNPNTQEDSAVYYVGADGRRHAFSNSKVFFSWYCDFSKVAIISASDLAQIPLGKNITYRPGLRLVKFPSVKTVYLVQSGAILHPIADEATAIALFGANWSKQVSDISEAFYGDYTIDSQVSANASQLAALNVSPTYPSGNLNIQGYMDPALVSGSLICLASPSNTSSTTSVSSVAWPFTDIPRLYIFTQYLDTNSASSASIRSLQEILTFLGPTIYPEAKVTGNFGPATQAAVKRFQAKNTLAQTGALDTGTRAALNSLLRSFN